MILRIASPWSGRGDRMMARAPLSVILSGASLRAKSKDLARFLRAQHRIRCCPKLEWTIYLGVCRTAAPVEKSGGRDSSLRSRTHYVQNDRTISPPYNAVRRSITIERPATCTFAPVLSESSVSFGSGSVVSRIFAQRRPQSRGGSTKSRASAPALKIT
jgi:hypothetical protein